KSEAGKRLGYWVCMAVLHRMLSEGFRRAGLGTDDGRFPAIKTYLHLGFEPRVIHDTHRARWRRIFEDLGMADEAELRFAHLLTGPLHEF
ncbi:MAG: hypothetical protein KAU28_01265, partial [Phycisphaerae bacterium]|nr:hypothetical protein [Phycisphaerae bacterium]